MTRDLHLSYDREDDALYIAFDKGREATSISLNDNVILRFDPATREAVGLTLLDFSRISAGEALPLVRLKLLPDELRQIVWQIITRPPISAYLRITGRREPAGVLRERVSVAELVAAG